MRLHCLKQQSVHHSDFWYTSLFIQFRQQSPVQPDAEATLNIADSVWAACMSLVCFA